ncbi:MAG: hypothetical protein Q9219_004649 [cf. Caloplaca sp. 3 TL-2023]
MAATLEYHKPHRSLPVSPGDRPLAYPPPGQTANFEHPSSNSFRVNIAAAVCLPIILIVASTRIYATVRLIKPNMKGLHDFVFMLAIVCTICYIALIIAFLNQGLFGTHIWELTLSDLKNRPFLLWLLLESLWGPFIWFIKVALFQLYMAFFDVDKRFKRLCFWGIWVTGVFYLSISVAKLAVCAPRKHQTYILAFGTARCSDTKVVNIAVGVFNIISDLYLFVLPIPQLAVLKAPLRRKIKAFAVFMTAASAVVASIMGLYYRIRVNTTTDVTWKMAPMYLSILMEMTCGIIILCMPYLALCRQKFQPSVNKFFARRKDSTDGEQSSVRLKILPVIGSLQKQLSRNSDYSHGFQTSSDSGTHLQSDQLRSAGSSSFTALPRA